jgi:ferredoxin
MKLVVDPIKCTGHGMCAELFPEGVELDDWGYPVLRALPDDPKLAEHARRAAKACPALALRLSGSSQRAHRVSGR